MFSKLFLGKLFQVKEEKQLVVLNNAKELYDHLGIVIDGLDNKSEFSIYNLGDFHWELPYVSPLFRANFFSFVFVKNSAVQVFLINIHSI
jgi:hypothetical protein